MKARSLAVLGAALILCGCQTGNQADYVQIGYGPSFDVAHAQCEIRSGSVNQGYIAIGSPAFVAGAGLGNAIGNAVAQDQFMKNCLIINGWKKAPRSGGTKAAPVATASAQPAPDALAASPGIAPPGGWINQALYQWSVANRQCDAGNKTACGTRNKLGAQLRAAGVNPA
jgi:hypothetical protein